MDRHRRPHTYIAAGAFYTARKRGAKENREKEKELRKKKTRMARSSSKAKNIPTPASVTTHSPQKTNKPTMEMEKNTFP